MPRKYQETLTVGIDDDLKDMNLTILSLRDVYTSEIFETTVGTAQKKVNEIVAWMKDNAPWQDRPALWIPSQRGGYYYKPAANARMHLRGWVDYNFRDQESKERLRKITAKANKANYERLRAINKAREEFNNSARRLEEGKRKKKPLKRLPADRRAYVPDPVAIHRENQAGDVQVTISHGDSRLVPYALWLEYAHGGRYNIIRKAMDHWHPKIMRGIQMAINAKRPGTGYALRRREYYERQAGFRKTELEAYGSSVITPGRRRDFDRRYKGEPIRYSPRPAPEGESRYARYPRVRKKPRAR